MYTGFVSINSVLDRIYRHPLLQDMPFESALVWISDVIRLIGSPAFMQHKIMRLGIEDYRCMKPKDMVYLQSVRRVITPYLDKSSWDFINGIVVEDPQMVGEEYQPMVEATDPFHEFYNQSYISRLAPENVYKINGNYIYTSFDSGIVDLAYDAILLDDDGHPMIPNDPSIEKAIENYIKSQYFSILSDLGKDTSRAAEKAEKEYCWYIGQSQSHSVQMSLDKRETLSNVVNRLMINDRPHDSFYRQMSHSEKMKKL